MKPSPILHCTLAIFIGALPANAQETAPPAATDSAINAQVLTGPLSLEDSIRIALRTQGGPGAAQLQASSAQESIKSARAGYAPQVTGRLGYDYLNNNSVIVLPDNNGVPGGIISGGGSGGTTSTDIAVSQNLFDSGRTRQRVRSAQARSQSAVGSFGSARSSLAFQVAQAFYEQLRQEKLTQQFAGQVALAEQQVQQVRAQIEAGTVARVDILSVQVALRQARFDQVTAQKNLAVARVNFRNVLGLERGPALQLEQSPRITAIAVISEVPSPPAPLTPEEIEAGTSVPELAELPAATEILQIEPPEVPQLATLEEYLEQARNLRPDLVQSRAAVHQSESSVALARIEQKPQVTANAGFNLDPRSTSDRRFQLGVGLSVPIFDGGGRSADKRAAQDELAASRLNLEQLEKDAQAEVEAGYTDISGQVERIANARVLVEQAQINLTAATGKYRLGLGIILDIVNAQTQLFSAQTSATQAVYDYEIARANLDRAVGRFAWADPGQTPPEAAPVVIPVDLKREGR